MVTDWELQVTSNFWLGLANYQPLLTETYKELAIT